MKTIQEVLQELELKNDVISQFIYEGNYTEVGKIFASNIIWLPSISVKLLVYLVPQQTLANFHKATLPVV